MDQLFDATLMDDDDDAGGDEALPGGISDDDGGGKAPEPEPRAQSASKGAAGGAGVGVGAGASAAAEFGFDPFAMDDGDDEGGDEALPGGVSDDEGDGEDGAGAGAEGGATSGVAEGKTAHTLAPIREARVQSSGRQPAGARASGHGGGDFVSGGAASGGGEMGVSMGAAPVSRSGAPRSAGEGKSGDMVDLTGGGGGGALGGPDDPATMAAGDSKRPGEVSATTLGLGDTSALQRDAQLNAEREVTMAHQAARVEELQAAVERLTATVDAKVRCYGSTPA